ncbi:MAG TPA: acyltransferase [Actinospica sp.]|nr:acyltransferase [Actinospica sp.]
MLEAPDTSPPTRDATPATPATPPTPAITPRRPAGLDRLPSLTGLRWLAAFIVFCYHIGTLGVIHSPASGPGSAERHWEAAFSQGDIGVAFFFILSGFVLTWVARPSDTRTAFWRRRIAKIYPNHIVTWAIVIFITLALGDRLNKVVTGLNLALVQPWFYGSYHGFSIGYSVNTVSWSLGCEAFFYLCFPFVAPLLRRLSTIGLYSTALVLFGLTYCCQHWQYYFFPNNPQHSFWFVYMFPPVRSIEFWLGVVTALLVQRKRWYGPKLWPATLIAVGVYYLNGTSFVPAAWHTVYFDIACCLLIAAAAQADIAGAWSPWRWRPLVFLGEVSFAFYLVHVTMIQDVMRLWRPRGWPGAEDALVIPVLLAFAILLAYLLYRFVEMPCMRLLRPKRKTSVTAAAAPATAAGDTPSA